MNFKRYLIATVAVFVFIFLYEFLVHGVLLLGLYELTPNVWRDFVVMEANMPLAMCFQLALAAWTTFVFTQVYEDGGMKNGLLFGLFFGVFAGILTASWFLWLPVSVILGWSWFAFSVIEGLGAGFILGLLYRK